MLVPKITKNPANAFSARKNLLLFYIYTDLKKALEYAEMMLAD